MIKKTHPASLKFKVALAALVGQPITDICQQYEVAQSLGHKWKKQLREQGADIFSRNKNLQKLDHDREMNKLYQRIGQLTTELEFLKQKIFIKPTHLSCQNAL